MASLSVVRRGVGDPTWRSDGPDGLWKTWRTPDGPITVHLVESASAGEVQAEAWGPGAGLLGEMLPGLVGERDDDAGFTPRHPAVAAARRRFAGWRLPRTGLMIEALVPAVIEQKVTGVEAFGSYRSLVRRYGEPAPGPGAAQGMWVAPSAQQWASIPSWEWTAAGVDAQRAATVRAAVRRSGRLERLAAGDVADALTALRSLPGVGRWTASQVVQAAMGSPDEVSFGDYHVAKDIGWVLTGAEVDDEGMIELLAPYAPHRYRVERLLRMAGRTRPRRGPRMTLPEHVPGIGRGVRRRS